MEKQSRRQLMGNAAKAAVAAWAAVMMAGKAKAQTTAGTTAGKRDAIRARQRQ